MAVCERGQKSWCVKREMSDVSREYLTFHVWRLTFDVYRLTFIVSPFTIAHSPIHPYNVPPNLFPTPIKTTEMINSIIPVHR